jgi:hypothetical protein
MGDSDLVMVVERATSGGLASLPAAVALLAVRGSPWLKLKWLFLSAGNAHIL